MAFKSKSNDSTSLMEREAVLCHDLIGLIRKTLLQHNMDGDKSLAQLSIDRGGGFLKICVNFIHDPKIVSPTEDDKGRFRYQDRINPKKRKMTSVQTTLVLGIVEDIPELYRNVEILHI